MATEHISKMRDLVHELLETINRQEKAIQNQQSLIASLQKERNELRVRVGTLTQDMGELARNRSLPREPTQSLLSPDAIFPILEQDEVQQQERIASPASGEYENDQPDFGNDSLNLTPAYGDSQDEVFQESSQPGKKEVVCSQTGGNIEISKKPNAIKERHSTGQILDDVHKDAIPPQRKLSDSQKVRRPSGEYPPLPPKPKLSSSTAPSSEKISNFSPLSHKTNSSSPPLKHTATSPPISPQRVGFSKSHTLKMSDNQVSSERYAGRCATMSSQQAFYEHHKYKKKRKRSSDKATRKLSTSHEAGNVTGSTLTGNRFGYQFSPDMEERLQLKIEQGIEKIYGPIEKCIQSAISIQRYYRRWKMRQRYKTLRKEFTVSAMHPARPRAASMKLPVRAHSIRLKSNPAIKVSILDEFPEIKKLTNRLNSRNLPTFHPLQRSVDNKDVGPPARMRREASLEVQETTIQICEKSITPVRTLSATEDGEKENVLSPIPSASPEVVFTPSPEPDHDSSQEIKLNTPFVPTSLSVDFLASSGGDEQEFVPRPHSVSIMSHIARSKSMEELLAIDNESGIPRKPKLKPQESATSLKKKTNIGITLFNRKPAKGILYLVLQGILKDSPKDVAHFIKTQYGLSKAMIGKFFSDLHNEFSMSVLDALVDSMNFTDKPIDDALRSLQETFQITGEAQLIERIVSIFAIKYFNDNIAGVMSSEDSAFVLSYAIMMLNTDLHSPQVRHHMTSTEWTKMNKGNNSGEDFPPDFLLQIYQRIQKEPFKPGQDHLFELEALQRTILGGDCPRIVVPHRQFRFQISVNEVAERGPLVFSTHHARVLFVFNDILLVCKPTGAKKQHPMFTFRSCFSLLNTVAVQCDSLRKYKNGVQLVSSFDGKKLITCSCDSAVNQTQLMKKLNESIQELAEIEQLRIATQSHQQAAGRRPSIGKERPSIVRKVSGPFTIPNEEHELSSDVMVICRSNTLVKSGSFPAISELAESDSLSDCTVASSPPSITNASVQASEPSLDSQNFVHRSPPHRTKTPPKSTKFAVNGNQRDTMKSPTQGSPAKAGNSFLNRLRGKGSSYTVNHTVSN